VLGKRRSKTAFTGEWRGRFNGFHRFVGPSGDASDCAANAFGDRADRNTVCSSTPEICV